MTDETVKISIVVQGPKDDAVYIARRLLGAALHACSDLSEYQTPGTTTGGAGVKFDPGAAGCKTGPEE